MVFVGASWRRGRRQHSRSGDRRYVLGLHELQRGRVHAVTQAGRAWAVVEDVAEMGVTLGALHLVAYHAQADVAAGLDVLFGDRLPEAGPAGAGIKFRRRAEKGIVAADAAEQTLRVQVPILAGESALGAGVPRDIILLGCQLGLPFGVGLYNFGHALRTNLRA